MTPAEFWAKVEKNGPVPDHCPEIGPCWLWRPARVPNAYGSALLHLRGETRKRGAHRAAWELTYRAIPDGLWVLHRCDTPACVRPEHLFLGTRKDNARDAAEKGRSRFQAVRHARTVEREWGRPLRALLEDLRLRKRLSQVRVAHMLGVSQSTVSIWERKYLDSKPDRIATP